MTDDIKRLLDQFGEPIPPRVRDQLGVRIAPISSAQNRPPFEGHLAFGMEPARLGRIVRGADYGQSKEWMILAEEIEELFPHYSAVLGKRRRQVVQQPITVAAATDPGKRKSAAYEQHAQFVRDWLDTGVLQEALFDITDAFGKGYSGLEIIWRSEPGSVTPAKLHYIQPQHFETSNIDGQTLWLRVPEGFATLNPLKFLVHRHPSKSGMAIRSGLTRLVCFMWLFAAYTARDWQLFLQGYGLPLRLGRYGPEAGENDKRVLWRAVQSIAGDVAAIVPKSMEMEFIEAKNAAGSAEVFAKRADWLNQEVSKLVLGSTAGTDAIRGSHAVGREHRAVEQDVERYDAGLLATTLNRQLVPAMVALTFGPQDKYPVLTIGRPDEVPLTELTPALEALLPLGLKVRADEIRERLQLSPPGDDDDDVLGGKPEPPGVPRVPDPPASSEPAEMSSRLRVLLARHTQEPDVLVGRMADQLANEAAGALAGLTDQVRQAVEGAADMHDLVARVQALKLDDKAFAEAMARGMALAHIVGQASLLEELDGEARADARRR